MSYDPRFYSRNDALRVFLHTLSYHRIGADFLTNRLVERNRARVHRFLDIGSGEGTFASELLLRMHARQISGPDEILAIDPDPDNLKQYQQRLAASSGAKIHAKQSTLEESGRFPPCDVVVCSHSLYGTLENPNLSDSEKTASIDIVLESRAAGGLVFISLASRNSPAYQVKQQLLNFVGEKDNSAYADDVSRHLKLLGASNQASIEQSYMDVTALLKNDALLLSWCSYFCRMPEERLAKAGVSTIREMIRAHATHFKDVGRKTREMMTQFPADCGEPNEETIYLPHEEAFFMP